MGNGNNSTTASRWLDRRLFVAGLVLSTVGCQNLIKRGQSPDDGPLSIIDKNTKYVADVCDTGGLNYIKTEGVALVVDLDGTGSPAKPSALRKRLIEELDKLSLSESSKELVASENTEMVLVKGLVPPGVRKGDRYDLEIIPLNETDGTSLSGGTALPFTLRDTARVGRTVKSGHVHGNGQGKVIVNSAFESRQDRANDLAGVIMGGGIAKLDRDLRLVMRGEEGSFKNSTAIGTAINDRFSVKTSGGLEGAATPKTDRVVLVTIPEAYRHNVGRFAQVLSNMAFLESPGNRVNRIDALGEQLQSPETTGLAAIRLEAIGKHAVPALIRGLASPDEAVQVSAAQALAYIGENDGIDVLERAARENQIYRWNALAALTSLRSSSSRRALENLLDATSAEARYGAFRALRLQGQQALSVADRRISDRFHFAVVENSSEPLLHFARRERPEIVIFNDELAFNENLLYVQTGLTVKSNGPGTVLVSSYKKEGTTRDVCSSRVSDVFQTVAQAGYDYETLLRLARQAKEDQSLEGRLAFDALPAVGRAAKESLVASQDASQKSQLSGKQDSSEPIKDSKVQPAAWISNLRERFAR